ncbi:hypothetical protein JYT84_00375 [bacterium AH-315-M10]|nr:hypothetical protein [bacterium AH-315-M10]
MALVQRWLRENNGPIGALHMLLIEMRKKETTRFMRAALVRTLPFFAHHVPSELPAIQELLRSALSGSHGPIARVTAAAGISGAQLRTSSWTPGTGIFTLGLVMPESESQRPASPFRWRFKPIHLYDSVTEDLYFLLDTRNSTLIRGAIQALSELRDRDATGRLWALLRSSDLIYTQRAEILDYFARFPQDRDAEQHVVDMATGREFSVKDRAYAASLLGRFMVGSHARRTMRAMAVDMNQDKYVRRQAQKAQLLLQLDLYSVAAAKKFLNHPNPTIRAELVLAVYVLRNKKLDKLLVAALRDEQNRAVLAELTRFTADREND